jgi:hypothetical protein
VRSDAPADFAAKADAFAASLPQFVTETNASAAFVDQRAIAADASATAAAGSATTAAQHEQGASDQAALANTARQGAEAAATAAELSAALAGAATGIDTTGKEGLPLVVDASGMVVASSGYKRYDVAALATTTVLDLAKAQVFSIAVNSNRTLSIVNPPAADRSMTATILLTGNLNNYTVNWPTGITWDGGNAPTISGTMLLVVLHWAAGTCVGSRGAAA